MRIITYNVNGIRSAITKGLLDWLKEIDADIVLFQELKAAAADIGIEAFQALGYHCYLNPAQKKGYSGVAILSKQPAINLEIGCGIEKYDNEGRIIRADYEGFSVMSLYLPSGSSGEDRQAFKYEMMDDFLPWIIEQRNKYPNLIIGGDYNICHRPIDIHNPKSNAKSSGFLPEERSWMEKLIVENQFIDSYREFNQEGGNYTWWSFRFNARAKNLGWRIDYLLVSPTLLPKLKDAQILPEVVHSDHCPVLLDADL
jgi:exodeoxyribonuclease-3